MILERTFYGVECDGCGCDLEDEFGSAFFTDSESFAEEVAKDSGWIKVGEKHFCEDCHRYGDNDELILGDGTVIQPEECDYV